MNKRVFSVKACLCCGWKRRVQVNKSGTHGFDITQEEADAAVKIDTHVMYWSRFCSVCVLEGEADYHQRRAREKREKAYTLKARRKAPGAL